MAYTPINRKKVARIMEAMGFKGFTTRRCCVTTKRGLATASCQI